MHTTLNRDTTRHNLRGKTREPNGIFKEGKMTAFDNQENKTTAITFSGLLTGIPESRGDITVSYKHLNGKFFAVFLLVCCITVKYYSLIMSYILLSSRSRVPAFIIRILAIRKPRIRSLYLESTTVYYT